MAQVEVRGSTRHLRSVESEEAKQALRTFWEVWQPMKARVNESLMKSARAIPAFAEVLKKMTAERQAAEQSASEAAQERALLHGDWRPLSDQLSLQGQAYAEMGVEFSAWFELTTLFREQVRTHLFELARKDVEVFLRAADGLNRYIDVSLALIGEAYLTAKQRIIGRQQEAIRELSTPVLQVRDRLLIIPVVGMVDTQRARQLTEALLRSIRERRARAVVMDITGVPIVDSRVANHLVQTCEAARLMGAHVFITGISSAIAQALVTIGAELRGVPTLGDLQTGIEAAEEVLRALATHPGAPTPAAAPTATAER